jgi:DNA-binding transcriptional LysR family regulator
MEMRQLRYFLAVAERMHFTRAAELLHLSQPALSQQIRMLEEEIGVKLLERSRRRVQLTAAGMAFRARAQAALEAAAEAASDARMAERGEAGSISIGFVTTAAVVILPTLLHEFGARFPRAVVELRELEPRAQMEALEQHRITFGLSSVPSALPSLESRLLAEERLLVALPSRHPAARRPSVHLKDLARERFLLPPRGLLSGIHEGIIAACHSAGFEPSSIQPTRLAETAVCLVARNLGIALVPESFRHLKVGGVVYRPLTHEVPVIRMYAIRSKQSESPLADNFWRVVESMARTRESAAPSSSRPWTRVGTLPRGPRRRRR